MSTHVTGRFTGWHMTAIIVAFFAVVVTVNLFMARMASATFGGVVVDNSYVASQHFNRWLDEAATEKAIGWSAETIRTEGGGLSVTVTGLSAGPAMLVAVARHPLGGEPDQQLTFERQADGRFLSRQSLPAGRWRLRLEVSAQGRKWRTEGDVL